MSIRSAGAGTRGLAFPGLGRRRRLEERLAAGELWQENDLVFCTETGEALHPDRFSRAFERAAQSSGLPRIRMHDLRHTWATLALQAGIHRRS